MIDQPLNMRDHAVAHVNQGFRVFKCRTEKGKEKHPLKAGFQKAASDDPAIVAAMWSTPGLEESLQNNIGAITGGWFIVLDVDVKDGKKGLESLDALIDMGLDTRTRYSRTPSGGYQYFYQIPPGTSIGCSTGREQNSKLGPGIDVRADGGHVLLPGSSVDGNPYEWVDDGEMLFAPDWIIERLRTRAKPNVDAAIPLVDQDDDATIARCIHYLVNSAPEAIEGDGGNHQTYTVAAWLKDAGASAPIADELMLEHWNPVKALPPWAPEELSRIVNNAFQYGRNPPGVSNPRADFSPVNIAPWPAPTRITRPNPAGLPKRKWIIQDFLVRCFAAALVSPGGMGKTQLIINLLLAIAANRPDISGMPVTEQTGVWYWNQEDDMDELNRRFAAAMQHHGVSFEDIDGRIHMDSGVERPLILVYRTADGRLKENTPAVNQIIEQIRAQGIGLFVFDPLVEFHEAEENDNVEMRLVMATARRIAVEAECAVLAAAHTRKPSGASSDGFAGDADAMRGAGAQVNVSRLVHTLFYMSVKDAKRYGVPADQRHLYVRLDTGKSNLSLIDGRPKWLRRVSVPLADETVGVLEVAKLTERGPETDLMHLIAEAIASGLPRGAWHSTAEVLAVMDESCAAAFGDKSNVATKLNKCVQARGEDLKEKQVLDVMTDAGTLRVTKTNGFKFNLREDVK